jgi:hypothetical protein
LIEEINQNNDDQLQSSLQVYDGCSGISYFFSDLHLHTHFTKLAGPDECQVAADVYQCGRDLAPSITNDIFTRSKGSATVVSYMILRYLGKRKPTCILVVYVNALKLLMTYIYNIIMY